VDNICLIYFINLIRSIEFIHIINPTKKYIDDAKKSYLLVFLYIENETMLNIKKNNGKSIYFINSFLILNHYYETVLTLKSFCCVTLSDPDISIFALPKLSPVE
jgi:hypothetical protein